MNKSTVVIALFAPLAGCTLPAQVPAYSSAPYSVPAQTIAPRVLFTAEQLDVLLGPIALYPDALLALMLPASTTPSDIVLAARYLQTGGDPAQAESQPWEDSVRSLAHYPQVVRWMDENLAWTKQLGDAFAGQPDDVMNTVQRLRSRARAAGTLMSTPEQQIVYENNVILIVPTRPDVIYVPYYDPAIVYAAPYTYRSPGSYFSFSTGLASGWWLSYGMDWHQHRVWSVDRSHRDRYWREHRHDWHRAPVHRPADHAGIHHWQPRHGPRPSLPGPRSQDSREEHRDSQDRRRSDRNAQTSRPADFVGPTAAPGVLHSPVPHSVPKPTVAPPLRHVTQPPAQQRPDSHRPDRTGGGRGSERTPTYTAPRPAPVVGPVAPPPSVHQGRPSHSRGDGGSGATQASPPPRPAPPLRYTPSAAPAAPAGPQAAPQQQAPAQQTQQASSSNEEERRRPPFVRPPR